MEIQNECEAAVAFLTAVVDMDGGINDLEATKIANVVGLCRRFSDHDLVTVFRKGYYLKDRYSVEELIRISLPFIGRDFGKTFYAMICDIVCSDGKTSAEDLQLLKIVADELQLKQEESTSIAEAFMTRYAWNIHVV